ncbi:hypothetical protein [Dyella flagellata]|uniref:DUF202 domain-containing protein n=1 Tax=Dyella flagellata TaxID=1867833 RepID=A0ABQ5X6M8_9GAMM|nr:hypothetical protein [Dyella flagellata]GLQ87245.1 hypothetical protein GCM10007898_08110 [Dyella flagellata]
MPNLTEKTDNAINSIAAEFVSFPAPNGMTQEQWEAQVRGKLDALKQTLEEQHSKAVLAKSLLDTLKYFSLGAAYAAAGAKLFKNHHQGIAIIALLIGLAIAMAALFVLADVLDQENNKARTKRSERVALGWAIAFTVLGIGACLAVIWTFVGL